MRSFGFVALAMWLLLPSAACNTCKDSVGADVSVDFSSVRLSGTYLCDADASCTMEFQDGKAVLNAVDEGKRYRITYIVEISGNQKQRQRVVYETEYGDDILECLSISSYREETWSVPTLVLRQQRTEIDEHDATLTGTFINGRPGPWYAALRSNQHFIDRTEWDAYLGVRLVGVGVRLGAGLVSGDPLIVTRDGRPFDFRP